MTFPSRPRIVVALLMAGAGTAEPASRLSGPFVHENLAVYLIHGPSQPGPTPLTLAEAMAKGIGPARRVTLKV